MNVSIIGGGVTGLVTAYKLSKKGYKVTVFESSYFLGGQASVVNLDGSKIPERGYHHLFRNDIDIIELIDELNLTNSLKWYKSSVGMYSDKKLFPFSTPKDLLNYKPISLLNRFKLGLISLYLKDRQSGRNMKILLPKIGLKNMLVMKFTTKFGGHF